MGMKLDQHEAINLLKEMAIELGRTPTWYEIQKVISKHHIANLFGGMVAFCHAAGLQPASAKRKMIILFLKNRLINRLKSFLIRRSKK